jgi:AbrB family looped-hinge helix DNA binding protein
MANHVTSKGQVTIPKKVRSRLGIRPGSAVVFELTEAGEVILRKVGARNGNGGDRKVKSPFARLRGRATVKMRTEEILALTRGA